MINTCACCGEKISFLDVGFDYITVDDNEYKICAKCRENIARYKNGQISIDKVISNNTDRAIEKYVKQIIPEQNKKVVEENNQSERKALAQQNNPLYDDIHQIAGDLRFIKNLIIAGLVLSVILGIVAGLSVL